MTTTIEKYRVVVEIDGQRYAILRELKFNDAVCVRLTDRGQVCATAEEQAGLEAVAKAFDDAVAKVVKP